VIISAQLANVLRQRPSGTVSIEIQRSDRRETATMKNSWSPGSRYNLEQNENAPASSRRKFDEASNNRARSDRHDAKLFEKSSSTECGMQIDVSEEQDEKTPDSI
jgi:hypothetical protein